MARIFVGSKATHCKRFAYDAARRAARFEPLAPASTSRKLSSVSPPQSETAKKFVLGLHGFLGFRKNLYRIEKALQERGHVVKVLGYPSRSRTAEDHAEWLVAEIERFADDTGAAQVDFFTHSFGSHVLRLALARDDCPALPHRGRLCLIGPCLAGSALARAAAQLRLGRLVLGDAAGAQLAAAEQPPAPPYPVPAENLLVVETSFGKINPFISEANDGVLGVSEQYLEQPHWRVRARGVHVPFLYTQYCRELVVAFLERGAVLAPPRSMAVDSAGGVITAPVRGNADRSAPVR